MKRTAMAKIGAANDGAARNGAAKGGAALDAAPASLMMWALADAAVEDAARRERALREIRARGFGGVAVFVRSGSYRWSDPQAAAALAHVAALCRDAGMACWVGADPRALSEPVARRHGGVRLMVSAASTRPDAAPLIVPLRHGRFTARCAVEARPVHTITEGRVHYIPRNLLRAYAVARTDGPLRDDEVIDVTSQCACIYDVEERYVEAAGAPKLPRGKDWSILVIFRVEAVHFDYSSRKHMTDYLRQLRALVAAGVRPDAFVWDEPGFTCTFGCMPYTDGVWELTEHGVRSWVWELWKLFLPAADGSHLDLRRSYASAIAGVVERARTSTRRALRPLGLDLDGMHDTWRWESADMSDIYHGSLDVWRHGAQHSAGFVDLGSAQLLRGVRSPHHANLAVTCALGASLGRLAPTGRAYHNLWTAGEGATQTAAMQHGIDALCAFGLRWIAHIYGPAGTPGNERSFLGLPYTPGYPEHSTWAAMPRWTAQLERMHAEIAASLPAGARAADALPEADAALLFPVDRIAELADRRADALAREIFDLVLALLDRHWTLHLAGSERSIPRRLPVLPPLPTAREAQAWLEQHCRRPFTAAPRGAWVTRWRVAGGYRYCLVPSRSGARFEGVFETPRMRVDIPPTGGLLLLGDTTP